MRSRFSIKSIVVYLLCLFLVLTIMGCARKSATDDRLVFGFANSTLQNSYCATMAEGALSRARELGITLNVVDNQMNATHQLSSIENFMTMGVQGIMILPVEASAIEAVVREAREQGIYVISNSVPVNTSNIFVSADNYEMGYNIGKAAAEWLNANKGGRGQIAYLNQPALPTMIYRENGFREAIAQYSPAVEIVMTASGGTSPEEGLRSSETILQAYPNIDAIVGYSDASALGATAAVEATGRDPAGIFVGGVDATPEAIAKIKEGGPFKATVDNVPFENGRLLVDLLVSLRNGEQFDFTYVLPTKIVDASNVHEY